MLFITHEMVEPTQGLTKYICNACRYKFVHKKGTTANLRCPYCSSENVIEDTFSIGKMIDESD